MRRAGRFFVFITLVIITTSDASCNPIPCAESNIQREQFLFNPYFEQAESDLLSGEFDKAIDGFQEGYEFGITHCKVGDRDKIEFRALLGLAFAHAFLSHDESVQIISNRLEEILHPSSREKVCFCNDEQYVLGPDQEPYQGWCKQTVKTCGAALNDLICFVPRPEVQIILRRLVMALEQEGLHCCARGGMWKACVAPLAKKLHIWSQKWNTFGIPPDPSWD